MTNLHHVHAEVPSPRVLGLLKKGSNPEMKIPKGLKQKRPKIQKD